MNIILAVLGGQKSLEWTTNFVGLVSQLQGSGHSMKISMVEGDLNKLLGGDVLAGKKQSVFQDFKYDFIIIIRNDVLVNIDMINRLVGHNRDFVCGAYRRKDAKTLDIWERMDNAYFCKHGNFEYVTTETMEKWVADGGALVPIESCGEGIVCIKSGAIEKLEYPWFRPVFQELLTPTGNKIIHFTTEFTGFCMNLRDRGVELWVDPMVRASLQTPMLV